MDALTLTYFPLQKLSYTDKDDAWKEACINGVINICYTYGRTRRSTAKNKRRNYNLFNNKIDKTDFDYVLNPFNLSKEKIKEFNFPASLQSYDTWSKYLFLLLGEESKRIFNPIVMAINDDAVSQKQKQKKEEILQVLQQMLMAQVDPSSVDPNNPPPPPEELERYQHYTPKMMQEVIAERLLNHYYRKEYLDNTFNTCFKDVLIAGEEIVRIDKIGDGPKVTRVNPMEIWYQLNNNSEILDDAEKIYERNQLTVSEIIDQFYEYLTPEQIDELESWGQGANTLYNFGDNQFMIPEVDSIYAFEDNWYQRGIPVHRVRWKSKKKVGTLHFLDENGEEQETLVEETFKVNKQDKTQWVEWFWINEYWEGVRIGQDMYLHPLIRPRKQQFRTIDNLSECKSGYIGQIYSAINAQSTSMMDRLVPWIYLYLIVWYRTELAMAKNIGKIALIETSIIPDTWEPEKWMYYAQAMGFGFINSYNEGNRAQGINTNLAGSNSKALDLETGNYIQGHIQILAYIEQKFEDVTGVSRQRLGSIQTSELVGNTERAVTQSSHITEPYFAPHEFFKLRTCAALIEVAKECLEGKTKNFQYITDDLATVLFEVQGDEFNNADYDVFMTNAIKDQKTLDGLQALMQAAIQNDKIQISSVVDVLNSNSPAEIKARLKQGEEEFQKAQQQSEQAKQALEKSMHDEQLALEHEKMDREDTNKQLDRENQLSIAEMKALGGDAMGNQGDDSAMIINQAKIELEKSKLAFQKSIEDRKANLEAKKIDAENKRTQTDKELQSKQHQHEKTLKEKELASKEKIARMKPKTKK